MKPWGPVEWIFKKLPDTKWSLISSISFEDRSLAINSSRIYDIIDFHSAILISPLQNEFTTQIEDRIRQNEVKANQISKLKIEICPFTLMEKTGVINKYINGVISRSNGNIVVDISSMPKRFFLFVVKRLLDSIEVKSLVVVYARPKRYKEGILTGQSLPHAPFSGFNRTEVEEKSTDVIISVGYGSFNLADILQENGGKELTMIFPFPPGSPGYRRNWNLLHKFLKDWQNQIDIKRIHSMDLFGVINWLENYIQNNGAGRNIEMIPLGPKPHALAMSLVYRKFSNISEVAYAQPQVYHPNYSTGIAVNSNGSADITAYCLRVNTKDYF